MNKKEAPLSKEAEIWILDLGLKLQKAILLVELGFSLIRSQTGKKSKIESVKDLHIQLDQLTLS